MKVKFFDPINLLLPRDRIYSRLGYAKGVTKLEGKQRQELAHYIEEALTLIELKGAGAIMPKKDLPFESKSLSELLTGCQEAMLMAATAGNKIVDSISQDSSGKDVTRAVVFDAVASEMADGALNWIMNYFNHQLTRENKQFTARRFSAGYGDFLLENQKIIYDLLDLKQLGVSLSDNYLLIPEKTVTAVAGIRLKEPGEARSEKDK
ncbi:MAG: methionine synthase [Candidatus Omnitrophota bacterium]